ncbi:MAG: ATP-binding protein [Acidobacteriota bacterium]
MGELTGSKSGFADSLGTIALDNAFDAMIVTDAEIDEPGPRILYVNPAFTRLTGYTPEEVLGKTPRILQGPKTDRSTLDQVRKNLNAGEPVASEGINYRKDGSEFYVQWRIEPVHDPSGRVVYYVSTQRDITERKNVERMKSETIASVSHELRGPLTGIVGALDLIRRQQTDEPPDGTAELLEIADLSCQRLLRLVDTMLDAETLAAGRFDVELEPVDLVDLIEQTLELHRSYARELEVEMSADLPMAQARVLGNSDRVIQVITNLLSNAIKFSPTGGQVRIALRSHGERFHLLVSDDGPGIPESFRPHLFERFTRAPTSDDKRHSGLGLGLAITREIVDLLGGKLGYTTELGVGTTFTVELPEASGE